MLQPRRLKRWTGRENSIPAALASSSGIRLLVAMRTPPSWKKDVMRFERILLAARSGSWNSSRKRIGECSMRSRATSSSEYSSLGAPGLATSDLDLRSCSSREMVSSIKVLKCQRRFFRLGKHSWNKSMSMDFPVPTSPWSMRPLGLCNCMASSWLVRTRVRATDSLFSFSASSDVHTPLRPKRFVRPSSGAPVAAF